MSFAGRTFSFVLIVAIISITFQVSNVTAENSQQNGVTFGASNYGGCGVCGCGIPVTDSDGDGVPDCHDKCQGLPDDDYDGDPYPNCHTDCNDNNLPDICEYNLELAQPFCDFYCSQNGDESNSFEGLVTGGNGPHPDCGQGTDCNNNTILDSCEELPDSDGDQTLDCDDGCPQDPNKTTGGACGCGIPDSDLNENGTPDCQENCNDNNFPDICETNPELAPELCYFCFPTNNEQPPSFESFVLGEGDESFCGSEPDCNNNNTPDTCATELDDDDDGAINDCDACPQDPSKIVSPGTCGCGVSDVDSDVDGLADCLDTCPNDSNKTSPGTCGCGTADTDSDGDGTANCLDSCPSDPAKTSLGACGCGVADTDSDGDGSANCVDSCPSDASKTSAGVCGCGLPDVDSNENGTFDCNESQPECSGVCNSEIPSLDEDGDGVTNCDEVEDGTDACDNGSFKERLLSSSCAGPNGFFLQTNILTVINRQTNKSLKADVVYRDLFGIVQGSVSIVLGPEEKRDVIVNELGLAPDTYGTVCVTTDAKKNGAWSGGLTLYKERFDLLGGTSTLGLSPNTIFDSALYYPLTNPVKGKVQVPLNTNSLGTSAIPSTMIANWVRLTDAVVGDGRGLVGRLRYYDITGKQVGTDHVAIPDGGRFDFSGHDQIGQHVVGMAEFTSSSSSSMFYVESSRYVYEGLFAITGNFWTAYVIPNRAATGVPTIGRLSTLPNEIAIVELINSTANSVNAAFRAFDAGGATIMNEGFDIPGKGSRHLIITGDALLAGFNGSAEVSGPPESLAGLTLVYRFAPSRDLLLAFAPAFIEPIGSVQRTEFNSFIGHENLLDLTNSLDKKVTANIKVLNFDRSLLDEFEVKLRARATERLDLVLPADTYGTIVVDSGADDGLVVRNDVSRVSEYTLSFPGQ